VLFAWQKYNFFISTMQIQPYFFKILSNT